MKGEVREPLPCAAEGPPAPVPAENATLASGVAFGRIAELSALAVRQRRVLTRLTKPAKIAFSVWTRRKGDQLHGSTAVQ